MSSDAERIKTASIGLIGIEFGNWYHAQRTTLLVGSWSNFCNVFKAHALAPNWESDTLRDIRRLKMSDGESFMAYSARGRALQAVVAHRVKDIDLAEHLLAGMPRALYLEVEDTRYLRREDFTFSGFEELANHKYDKLRELKSFVNQNTATRSKAPTTATNVSLTAANQPQPMSEDLKNQRTWRFKSYFASEKLCRWCKTKCSTPSPAMRCNNNRSMAVIRIPPTYQPPPMPPLTPEGYVPEPSMVSTAATASKKPPGQPTSRPAGAGPMATVYGVEEMPTESVDVAATYEALDAFLQEEYLVAGCAPPSTSPIIVEIVCNGRVIHALADPGSGANLMSPTLAKELELRIHPLPRPVRVNLAIANGSTPEVLTHATSATFRCQEPSLEFGTEFFKIAKLHPHHDCILGIPLLSKFKLDVSPSSRCIKHVPKGAIIQEKGARERQTLVISAALNEMQFIDDQSELSKREERFLEEYKDLFPGDIPAVEDGEDPWLNDNDGMIPPLMQKESAKVRHKIVLTDPKAVINERQYGYPQKFLAAWRKLLDQHLKAGRIRKPSSQ